MDDFVDESYVQIVLRVVRPMDQNPETSFRKKKRKIQIAKLLHGTINGRTGKV